MNSVTKNEEQEDLSIFINTPLPKKTTTLLKNKLKMHQKNGAFCIKNTSAPLSDHTPKVAERSRSQQYKKREWKAEMSALKNNIKLKKIRLCQIV